MEKCINIDLHVCGTIFFGGFENYQGGQKVKYAEIDCDIIGYFTLIAFAKDAGCHVRRMWYGFPGQSLNLSKEIFGDKEVLHMVSACRNGDSVDIYCEGEGEVESILELSISDQDENDSDYEVNEEVNVEETDSAIASEYEMSEDELPSIDDDTDIHGKRHKREESVLVEYDPNCDHKVLEFKPGLCFVTPNQLHKAVQQYAILNGLNIRWKRSCNDYQEAVCVEGCLWRLYASWAKKESTFVIKVYQNEHTCCRSIKNRQATTKWIANDLVKGTLRGYGNTSRELQEEIMAKYTLEVPLMKCYKSKWLAEKIIHGTIEEHFIDLRSYIAALQRRYNDSTFDLMLERSLTSGMYDVFKRLYICFKPLLEGFKAGCRQFVGFDGTFIKHKVGGILLTAVGRDGNDGMYPLAWAVVEGENTSSWLWFLELLFKDLDVGDGRGWTFISDQQKGLLNYVCSLAPYAEQRKLFKAHLSELESEAQSMAMHEMRYGRDGALGCIDAAADFERQGPKNFCKAFFKTSTKCGTISNNMCETFNSYILSARRLPLVEMLEKIRKLLMVRQVQKSKLFVNKIETDVICPNVKKEIEKLKESVGHYVVRPSIGDKYEVSQASMERDRIIVDLGSGTCICRFWDLHKIPCEHAIACINFMKRNVEDYVDDCYKKTSYESAYAYGLEPLEGQKYWPSAVGDPVKPPPYKRLPGRPKKNNRRKSKEEEQDNHRLSRKGVGMKCSSCAQWGHNKRTCKGIMATSTTDHEISSTQEEGTISTESVRRNCKNCGGKGHNRRTCKGITSTIAFEDNA